jgi:hypothetical protein
MAVAALACCFTCRAFAVLQTMPGVFLAIVVHDLFPGPDTLDSAEPDPLALRDFGGGVGLARMISPASDVRFGRAVQCPQVTDLEQVPVVRIGITPVQPTRVFADPVPTLECLSRKQAPARDGRSGNSDALHSPLIQGGPDREPMRAGDTRNLQRSLYQARSELPMQFESGRP